MDKKRLSTAISLPEEVSGKIYKACNSINGVRWAKPEQLHLTLTFIGDADSEIIPRLSDELSNLKFTAFDLIMSKAAFFRSGIFLIMLAESAALVSLKKQIDTVLNKVLGFEADTLDFIPHITLARFKRRFSGAKQEFLTRQLESIFPASFSVDKFILYSSELSSKGAVHAPLKIISAKSMI